MRIDYNILWFEDNKSSFETKTKIVKEIIEDLGFEFPSPRHEIDGENLAKIEYDKYDLIIADLNLAGVKAPPLIDKIRHSDGVFTEVIFYSSDGEKAVREILKNYEIDGAYCAGRENDDFEDKVKRVIRNTIKKVQDVNNVRGLIMSTTSDIDAVMLEIIGLILEKFPKEISTSLIDQIFKDVGSSVNEKSRKYDKWFKARDIQKLMNDTLMFDSAKRLSAIQHAMEIIEHDILKAHKGGKFSDSYKSEVGEVRNIFAHVVLIVEDGIKKLKSKTGNIEFTDEYCSDIRKKLRKHHNVLFEIKEHLAKV